MSTKTIIKSAKSNVDPFAEFDQPVVKAKAVKTQVHKAPVVKATKTPKVAAKSSVKVVEKPVKATKVKASKSSAGSFQVGIIVRGETGTKSKFTVLEAKDGYTAITLAPAALNKVIKALGAPSISAKAKPSMFRMSVIAKDADGHTVSKSGRLEARTIDEALSLAPAALHKLVKAMVAA